MTDFKDATKRAELSRLIVEEGAVLLKNEGGILPILENKVAVFGRSQIDTHYVGTGSARCEAMYEINLLDGFEAAGIKVDKAVAEIYRAWCRKHPLSKLGVWGTGANSNPEMPLDEKTVSEAAERNDIAVAIIGRTSGENSDLTETEGNYYLTKEERNMLELLCRNFSKVAVIVNAANYIDLSFCKRSEIGAVLFVNQAGMEAGNAVANLITGKATPSGKLADTIAINYSDYPSSESFGQKSGTVQTYDEDIYVGYRYFETLPNARDKVLYPFGFGLSYTDFEITCEEFLCDTKTVKVKARVKNTGEKYSGKETVMIYSSAPSSKLGTPKYELRAFAKTKLLLPKEEEILSLEFSVEDMVSFDDKGVLGTADAFVLLGGEYRFFLGNNIRTTEKIGGFENPATRVIRKCTHLPTELKSRLTNTGEFEELDAIAEDISLGIKVHSVNKTVIKKDDFYSEGNGAYSYRLNALSSGIYRAKFTSDSVPASVSVNGIELNNISNYFEDGEDIILQLGTNEIISSTPVGMELIRNNTPICVNHDKATVFEAGKYNECSLFTTNPVFCDEDGFVKKGNAVRMVAGTGRFVIYKLDVKKAGTYNLRMRYMQDADEAPISECFMVVVSNVTRRITEPIVIKKTDGKFFTCEPFAVPLPKGEVFLKIVSCAKKTPLIASIELSPCENEAADNDTGNVEIAISHANPKAVFDRAVLPENYGKYDLRNVINGSITLDEFVDDLTEEELAALVGGKPHVRVADISERGIPVAFCSDGPTGIRQNAKVTMYPAEALLGCSFNLDLARRVGSALGAEAAGFNIDMLLGPGMNIHRNVLCGRSFEYLSEDPYVSGVMAAEIVKGIQEWDIGACPKHFAANSTEHERLRSNSQVSSRAMFEIYMRAFEIMIKRGNPYAIMTSYNHINGIKVCENPLYCKGVIRDDYGYEGILVTDWYNDSSHLAEVAAEHDLKMANNNNKAVAEGIKNGTIDKERVKVMAKRVLTFIMKTSAKHI